jgi:predicted acetyltransferase
VFIKNGCIISYAQLFKKKIWWQSGYKPFIGFGFICTLPEFRNKGYATELLRYVIEKNNTGLSGLFTKAPEYYEKLGFEVVPRRQYIIKKHKRKISQNSEAKIRRFKLNNDILCVMRIHKKYFKQQAVVFQRNFKDWQNQLSYFDEEKKLFLLAYSRGLLRAYIRCKLNKVDHKRVEIVEYASFNKNISFMPDFINFIFTKFKVNEIKMQGKFLPPVLKNTRNIRHEMDYKMMLRFNKTYSRNAIKENGLCFLEADGF